MAIKKLPSGKWEADFRPAGTGGKRHRRPFPTKKAAEQYEAEIRRQYATGTVVDARAARSTTAGQLWVDFRQHVAAHGIRGNKPLRPKTLKNYDFRWRHYVAPAWEYTPLSAISRERCRDWVANMTTANGYPASAGGVREGADVFIRMLDYAMERGLMEFNPMKSRAGKPVPLPAAPAARPNVYMTPAQLLRLSSLADDRMSLMILTAGVTGLRWSEISGLTAGEVDLGPEPRVIIPRIRSKTDASRTVQLPAQVAQQLRERGVDRLPADAPVFPAARGGAWSESFFRKRFRPVASAAATAIASLQDALGVTGEHDRSEFGGEAVTVARYGQRTAEAVRQWQTRLGLPATGETTPELWESLQLPQLSAVRIAPAPAGGAEDRDMKAVPVFHDLRHTAVSLALNAGLSIKLVQQMAGHKTAAMTLDVYGHLYDDSLDKAAAAMTGVLSEVLPE